MVKKILGVAEADFYCNIYGKLYIENFDVYFNISHTKNHTFAAINDQEIGIDAEDIEEYDSRVAAHYFTEDEQNFVNSSFNKSKAFFEIWTKKESYMKYVGLGFSLSPVSFSVLERKDCFFCNKIIDNNISLSICTQKEIKLEGVFTI